MLIAGSSFVSFLEVSIVIFCLYGYLWYWIVVYTSSKNGFVGPLFGCAMYVRVVVFNVSEEIKTLVVGTQLTKL